MASVRTHKIVAWIVFGVAAALVGLLYVAPVTIHLRHLGPDVACTPLGPDKPNSRVALIDNKAAFDLFELAGYASGRYSPEEAEIILTRYQLETVAACQDARLNRQTTLLLALAVSIAAFGAGFSLSRPRVQAVAIAESGAGEPPTEESSMEDEGK